MPLFTCFLILLVSQSAQAAQKTAIAKLPTPDLNETEQLARS
jgi:hypothetical protein